MDLPLTSGASPEVVFLETVESTNTYLAENAETYADYTVVASLNQTAGRGRKGRRWLSVPGKTLAFSVVVPFDTAALAASWLPIIAGVAARAAIREVSGRELELKWPNDLLVGGKKVGGILCQMVSHERSIVGVGTNIYAGHDELPENGTSLWVAGLEPHHAIRVLDAYLSASITRLREVLKQVNGFSSGESIASHLVDDVATIGKTVRVHEVGGESWSGLARELSPEGHLIVEVPGGAYREVVAADIEHIRE